MTRPGVARPSVLVVGAGIAGLASAIALAAAGCEVQVLERRAALPEEGAAITLWPNALGALDALGAGDAVRATSEPVVTGAVLRPDGSLIGHMAFASLRTALGAPPAVIGRRELLDVLVAARHDVVLRVGAEVTRWRGDAGHVELELADGEVCTADAAVAADGLGSFVARELDPRCRARYAGYRAWRAIVPVPLGGASPAQTWGHGTVFGYLPMRGGRTYWFASQNLPEHHEVADERRHLEATFGRWHEPIPSLLAATAPGAIRRDDIYDRRPLGHWSAQRMVVVGDAAHPMRPHLGQGGCQAIEDAVALGRGVALYGADFARAFDHLERSRRRRARRIVRRSALAGRVVQGEGALAALGRAAFARMPAALTRHQLARIAGVPRPDR